MLPPEDIQDASVWGPGIKRRALTFVRSPLWVSVLEGEHVFFGGGVACSRDNLSAFPVSLIQDDPAEFFELQWGSRVDVRVKVTLRTGTNVTGPPLTHSHSHSQTREGLFIFPRWAWWEWQVRRRSFQGRVEDYWPWEVMDPICPSPTRGLLYDPEKVKC